MGELEDLIQFNTTQLNDQDIAIEQEIEDNNNELAKKVSYRYEISQNAGYTWDTARSYCLNIGGDLAYHGLDTIEKRNETICNTLGRCDDPSYNYLLWGIHKQAGTTYIWEYIDGTLATDNDIIWYNEYQKSYNGYDCSYMLVNTASSNHMKADSMPCDRGGNNYYAFCEFEV